MKTDDQICAVIYEVGMCATSNGLVDEGYEIFSEAHALMPDRVVLFYGLMMAKNLRGERSEAIQQLASAIESGEMDVNPLFDLLVLFHLCAAEVEESRKVLSAWKDYPVSPRYEHQLEHYQSWLSQIA